MKKFITLVFTLAFAVSTLGCAGQPNDTARNDVFTDAFFTDVEQIYFCAVPVSGEQMEPVIRYLQELTLTFVPPAEQQESTADENEPIIYGFLSLRFRKTSGEEEWMILKPGSMSSAVMGTYAVEEEHYIEDLRAFFNTVESE